MPDRDSLYRLRLDLAQLRREFDAFAGKYQPVIEKMQDADRVSRQLAEAARSTREAARDNSRVRLSRGQTVAAVTVAAVAVGGFVLQLAHAIVGHH